MRLRSALPSRPTRQAARPAPATGESPACRASSALSRAAADRSACRGQMAQAQCSSFASRVLAPFREFFVTFLARLQDFVAWRTQAAVRAVQPWIGGGPVVVPVVYYGLVPDRRSR